MERKRYSEEQIIRVLEEERAVVKVMDLCRKYGMSDASAIFTSQTLSVGL